MMQISTGNVVNSYHRLVAYLRYRRRDRYDVLFNAKVIVNDSRDAECDAARALLAIGLAGELIMLDASTGKPRTIIDIERAARLTVKEGANGPRFVKWQETCPDEAPTAEMTAVGTQASGYANGVLRVSSR